MIIVRRLCAPCLVMLTLAVIPSAVYAADETTTTTTSIPTTTTTVPVPTTVAPPPTTGGGLDASLPGETKPPAAPSKTETVAQENAKKVNSKFDKATKKLLDAQLAADITSQDIQSTKATLLALNDQIVKNQALIAIRELPLDQLSKIIKKRAITLYQDSEGAPTDALEQFYYNRQTALASTAQQSNVTELKFYLKEQRALKTARTELAEQKLEAETKQAYLQDLSIQFAAQLEEAKKEYEKTAAIFLDANAVIGARVPIEGKMCPIAGPMTHVDDWGNPRSGGRTHKGNDIFNAFGTPNVAIVPGRIERNMDNLGGQGINLYGDDGNMYYYAHLSAFAGENRRVNQGDIVGYTGDSGNASGGAPHTHFEIRVGGSLRTNPYPVIRIICGV